MARTSNPWQTPRVIFNPETSLGLQRGINQLANAIRPTLGPLPRYVGHKNFATERPESLDNGAVIARRLTQLADRQADVGAMYMRNMLWRLHETSGDGTATAAVIFQTLFNEGLRYRAAGGDAMRLRRLLERGGQRIAALLAEQVTQVHGEEQYARLASAISYDEEISRELGAVFAVIGAHGRLDVRAGHTSRVSRRYVEGHYWPSALHTRTMMTNIPLQRAELEDAAILLSNLEVNEPAELVPVLEAALASGARHLLLVVKTISESALSMLLLPANRERLLVAAMKTPGGDTTTIRETLDDLALLTGARPLIEEAGDRLQQVRAEDLGQARRAWGDKDFLGISGGQGDPVAVREHVAALRAAYARASEPDKRSRLLGRLGALLGGSAILSVGALSPLDVDRRKQVAESTAEALRGALHHGVLPGGGVALFDCIPALQADLHATSDADERAALQMLIRACEAPMRTLLMNGGFDPSETMPAILERGTSHGFDVLARRVVHMEQAGLLDPATVVQAAADSAIRSAALALTIDVLVHRANPPDASTTP